MTLRVVHLATTVRTVFGVLDEHDNVLPQEPLTLELHAFSSDAFAAAFDAIADARDHAIAQTALAGDQGPAGSVRKADSPERATQ